MYMVLLEPVYPTIFYNKLLIYRTTIDTLITTKIFPADVDEPAVMIEILTIK